MQILIVDAEPVRRRELLLLIERTFDGAAVIEADRLADPAASCATNSDLVVINYACLPLLSIRDYAGDTPVLVLGSERTPDAVVRILRSGATAYALADIAAEELAGLMVRLCYSRSDKPVAFTDTERTILFLVAFNYRNAEIARMLNQSVNLIKVRLNIIKRKVQVQSRSDLIRYAAKHIVKIEKALGNAVVPVRN